MLHCASMCGISGVRASRKDRHGRPRTVLPAQNPHRPARCSLGPGTSSTLTRSGASRRCGRARFRLRRWPAAGVAWRRRSAGRRPPISSLWQRTSLPSSRSPRRCRRGPTDRGPGLGELLGDGALQLDGTDGPGRLCDLTLSSRTAAQRLVDALATGGLIPGARVAVVALAVAGATPGREHRRGGRRGGGPRCRSRGDGAAARDACEQPDIGHGGASRALDGAL